MQVRELDLGEDLVKDFDAGAEYADAVRIQRERQEGDQQFFLVEYVHPSNQPVSLSEFDPSQTSAG